ncbi:hypothetical protein LWI28_016148 [Acer negundo]|uniref:Uncharacterized protein n=1 Tax=Acer negundo TaxID=4023 RepID=A0AAD5IUZ8_ACENE|nr:hypothetical protein LWI28_016148 [Acer negundo]
MVLAVCSLREEASMSMEVVFILLVQTLSSCNCSLDFTRTFRGFHFSGANTLRLLCNCFLVRNTPVYLNDLMDSSRGRKSVVFKQAIMAYNSNFAFTSMETKVKSILKVSD